MKSASRIALVAVVLVCAVGVAVDRWYPSSVDINVVAINDFHGHLAASEFAADDGQLPAGGIDTLAAALQAWRKQDPALVFVSAGDLTGASQALSSLWADEPTVSVMNQLGLRVSALGNHDLDRGRSELLRMQNGGCQALPGARTCQFAPRFPGADFTYVAANVFDAASGKRLLPAYRIEQAHGIKLGFVGAVLQSAAATLPPSRTAGLRFVDEADAINASLPELQRQGVGVVVALLHQGGSTSKKFNHQYCDDLSGDITGVVKRLHPSIRVVISGHSHAGYLCKVDGRLMTQADMGGHVASRIRLRVDARANRLLEASAVNVVLRPGMYPADPGIDALLDEIEQRSAVVLQKKVATLAVPVIARRSDINGESPLGGLVADAMLRAGRSYGAQIAFINEGGLRADLRAGPERRVSMGQLRDVLPFSNSLVVMDLTGAQIKSLLELQWSDAIATSRGMLQVSEGFTYRWNPALPSGKGLVPGSLKLNGTALVDERSYRVIVDSFIAEGGDKFVTFLAGTHRVHTDWQDVQALEAHLSELEKRGKSRGAGATNGRIKTVY